MKTIAPLAQLISRATNLRPSNRLLLNAEAWSHAACCERMRVDRNGSVLAILSLSLPKQLQTSRNIDCLTEFLADRLRITDSFGWQPDGRLGVLLPDTPLRGAELVAREILEFINTNEYRTTIEISMYPLPSHADLAAHVGDSEMAPGVEQPQVLAFQSSAESVDRLFAVPLPIWKRLIDISGASVGLLAASPLMLVVAAAVATTSKGGAFFVQEREGLGGRRFKMYKFRSMIRDSDSLKAKLRRHSVQDGPAFKMHRDPRVTKIGRLLRVTSLDELPQL
ncbi:MAG: sugar transferase, partial [Planctomycetales bacterium]|nr:sugar transferase [Planctomycetales bacterium]